MAHDFVQQERRRDHVLALGLECELNLGIMWLAQAQDSCTVPYCIPYCNSLFQIRIQLWLRIQLNKGV